MDGRVSAGKGLIGNGRNLEPGDEGVWKVTEADEYDLWAEQI